MFNPHIDVFQKSKIFDAPACLCYNCTFDSSFSMLIWGIVGTGKVGVEPKTFAATSIDN